MRLNVARALKKGVSVNIFEAATGNVAAGSLGARNARCMLTAAPNFTAQAFSVVSDWAPIFPIFPVVFPCFLPGADPFFFPTRQLNFVLESAFAMLLHNAPTQYPARAACQ